MKLTSISSQKNTQIKWLKKLVFKKYRRQQNKFTVENLAIIYDALKSGYDFDELFVTQEFIDKHKEKFEYIQKKSKADVCYLMDESLNKHYSQLDTPSGITAVYAISSATLDNKKSFLYLNDIKDPGNIGTIMRTALAFDVVNIVLDSGCVDIYNAKAISAAKDALFKLNIFNDKDGTCLKDMKGDVLIYAANSHNGIDVKDVQETQRFCLVLGSESHGVDEDIVKLADENIHIKILDKIESLNVSSAAAILLYGLKIKG